MHGLGKESPGQDSQSKATNYPKRQGILSDSHRNKIVESDSKDPGEKRIMIHMFEEIKKRKIWARRRAIKSSSSLEKEQNSIQKCKI